MKQLLLLLVIILFSSCQFTETMVLNEDGSGTMTLGMDLTEMMAFSGDLSQDSKFVKMDTVVSFKRLFEEKKDSIAKLSLEEQRRLLAMQNYNMRMQMDPETGKTIMSVFTNFKNVNEANELIKGFNQAEGIMPGAKATPKKEEGGPQPDIIGVSYSYTNGKFKRDAFIKDKERHTVQMDSLKQAEAFMGGMKYTLKYTFPKRVVKSSAEDAKLSLDGKTIEVERSFLEYFKNPDALDLEVELEN